MLIVFHFVFLFILFKSNSRLSLSNDRNNGMGGVEGKGRLNSKNNASFHILSDFLIVLVQNNLYSQT